jgi:hypothetical protein
MKQGLQILSETWATEHDLFRPIGHYELLQLLDVISSHKPLTG